MTLYFLSGTEPTKACSYHEANNVLLEIAKDRLRKSNYSTGQAPVDIIKTDVLIDPRIFEDPEPSKQRRKGNSSYTPDPLLTDELTIPSGSNSDGVVESDPLLHSGETQSSTESTTTTSQQEQNTQNPATQPGQTSGTSSANNTGQPPIPQTHLGPIDEETPLPSFPPVESESNETETQEQNNGTIQGGDINPWL